MKLASLMTDWAAQVVRTNWFNLNGAWQLQPGATNDPVPTNTLAVDIIVTFPMEWAISGVIFVPAHHGSHAAILPSERA